MSPNTNPVWRENISILLLDGQSVYARAVGLCLGESPAVTLHVLSLDQYPPIRFSRHVRSFRTYAPGRLMEAIERCCAETHVDVLFPVDEVATEFVTTHRERFPRMAVAPPTPSLDNMRLGDKWALAEYLQTANIPHPQTILASSLQGHRSEFHSGHPVLLKPRLGGNGRGIRLFRDANEAFGFLAHGSAEPGAYIVQECIPGTDIDCSVLCLRGEILAFTVQRPAVTNTSFQPAGVIDLLHEEEVMALIRRLITATQWSGVAHIDCRYDERHGGIKVIEINPRYWGSIYGSLSAGVNFPLLACQTALGVAFPVPAYADVRYTSGGAAIKAWTRARSRPTDCRPSHRAWQYFASDPLPEIMEVGQRLRTKLTAWVHRSAE